MAVVISSQMHLLTLVGDDAPETFFCRGCNRSNLRADEMGRDNSKPSGFHSRCLQCKRDQTARAKAAEATRDAAAPPAPPEPEPVKVTPDWAAAMRRDGLIELVRRHRAEFDDICNTIRYRYVPAGEPTQKPRWSSPSFA